MPQTETLQHPPIIPLPGNMGLRQNGAPIPAQEELDLHHSARKGMIGSFDHASLISEQVQSCLQDLFAGETLNAVEFLSALCQYGTQTQLPLVPGQTPVPVAVIICQGVPDLVARPGWKWPRETTLILLQALEALTILVRFRRARRTEIHIPLGPRVLDRDALCARLAVSPLTNRKTQRLMHRMHERLQRSRWPWNAPEAHMPSSLDEACHEQEDVPEHHPLHALLTVLEQEGVSRPLRARLAFRFTYAWPHLVPAQGHTSGERRQKPIDDVPCSTNTYGKRDGEEHFISIPAPESERFDHRKPQMVFPPHASSVMEPDTSADLPSDSRGDRRTTIRADDEGERLYGKRMDYILVSQVPQGEEVHAEALEACHHLTTEEERRSDTGDHVLKQLVSWVAQDPDQVRLALVNTIVQRVFPDRHGIPEGMGFRWFAKSVRGYMSKKLHPSAEIVSWAATPLSYGEIEAALWQEHAYQEQFGQRIHRPFAPPPAMHISHGEHRVQEMGVHEDGAPQFVSEVLFPSHDQETQMVHLGVLDAAPPDEPSHPPAQTQPEMYVVENPEMGWKDNAGVSWAHRNLRETPLGSTCTFRELSTQHGRFVLKMVDRNNPTHERIWSSSREVRLYLDEVHAEKRQHQPAKKSFNNFNHQLQTLLSTIQERKHGNA